MLLEYQMAELARRQKLIQVQLLSYQDRLATNVWLKYETIFVVNNKPQTFLYMHKNVTTLWLTSSFLSVELPELMCQKGKLPSVGNKVLFLLFWLLCGITLNGNSHWYWLINNIIYEQVVNSDCFCTVWYERYRVPGEPDWLFSVYPDTRLRAWIGNWKR